MANVASVTVAKARDDSMLSVAGGPENMRGARLVSFTIEMKGNYNILGVPIDLSGIFPRKVLAVFCGPLVSANLTTGYLAGFVGASSNAPNGRIVVLRNGGAAGALPAVPDDTVDLTGYVATCVAIGY